MLDSTIREVRKRAWELWESEEEEERLEGCQMLRSTGIQPDLLLAGDWFCAIGEFIDAISCWKEAAEKWEDFEAITKLMNWFLKEGDMDLFENYCLKAAEQGHYPAICAIAHYYQSLNRLNEVIPSLDDDVYIWSQKAAKKGDSQSIRYLAEWSELCDIEKIEKDNDESLPSALDWYLKAAERDDIPSILKAAHILYHGMNVKPNLEKAIELFIKASRLASLPSTLLQIGHIYSLGHHEELGQDFVKAFELYEEAARGGDAEAIKCLADALYHGIGCEMNKEEAEELYHVAISAGSILAMPCLAKCLFHKKQTKDARQLISAFISKMSEDNSKNDIDDEIIDKILNELD